MFGMGTGGTPPLWSPDFDSLKYSCQTAAVTQRLCSATVRRCAVCYRAGAGSLSRPTESNGVGSKRKDCESVARWLRCVTASRGVVNRKKYGQASRMISTGRLNMLPCVHLRPIDEIIYLAPLGALRLWDGSS